MNHIFGYEMFFSNANNNNIRIQTDFFYIGSFTVTNFYLTAFFIQYLRDRFADQYAFADDGDFFIF